jgi:hypothetical protein
MRNVTTLFSRQRPSTVPERKPQGSVQTATGTATKPPHKRCLNEGGHKLYREGPAQRDQRRASWTKARTRGAWFSARVTATSSVSGAPLSGR